MGLIGYLLFCLAVAFVLFPVAYFLSKGFAPEGGVIHASYVCFFIPFLIGFLTLAFAQISETSSSELQARIASGELVDPGPAAFANWVLTVGGPLAMYVAISIPLFVLARKRIAR
jgi:hypothetical protein